MKPERWQQIDSVLQAVVAHPLAEREARLNEACAGDKSLRKRLNLFSAFGKRPKAFLKGRHLRTRPICFAKPKSS